MSTYIQIIYHIVFGTKHRMPSLAEEHRPRLFGYIRGILRNKNCHAYRIGGMEDHLHIATHLHPTVPLASLVKDIKLGCSAFIKETGLFPEFDGWQQGYGAFTCSYSGKDRLIAYIKNQQKHHRTVSFREEYRALLEKHGIAFEEKYLL